MSDEANLDAPTTDPDFNRVLTNIQITLAQRLLDKIKSGEATAADFNVARQLLKDNHIQAPTDKANPSLADLKRELPFPRPATYEAEAG